MRRLQVAAAALFIAAMTLTPLSGGGSEPFISCLACNWRALADRILNVLLFIPLGAAVAFRFKQSWALPIVIGALVSVAVEAIQVWIPGRDANLNDLIANTVGAAVGLLAVRRGPAWLESARRAGVLPSQAVALVAIGLVTTGAFLFGPTFPEGAYYAEWTPAVRGLAIYDGRVLDARVGNEQVIPGRIRNAAVTRQRLLGGMTIYIHLTYGIASHGLAPIFRVIDEQGREIVMLGADGRSAVYRYRSRGAALGLAAPDIRFTPRRAEQSGSTIRLVNWRFGRHICMTVQRAQSCRLGFTVGRTWAFLAYPGSLSPAARNALDVIWLALLFAPAGFFLRNSRKLFLIIPLVVVGLSLPPLITGIGLTPLWEYAAAIGALVFACGRGKVSLQSKQADSAGQLRESYT